MKEHYILYHANCYDGFGAAWAAWKVLRDAAEYIPVTHGEPPPKVLRNSGATCTIVDFAYPRDVLLDLRDNWGLAELTVIDHHKTAQEDLVGLDVAIFDMNKSGAMMAWEYWHPHDEPPMLVRYVEDRDLWRFELVDSREVSAALRMFPMDFETWEDLEENWTTLMTIGSNILAFTESQVEMMCKQARISLIGGHEVPVVNATAFWSEIGEYLLGKYPEYPFAASWHMTKDGQFKWSLRSRRDFDVSDVARQFGGGGHPQAAGFLSDELIGM